MTYDCEKLMLRDWRMIPKSVRVPSLLQRRTQSLTKLQCVLSIPFLTCCPRSPLLSLACCHKAAAAIVAALEAKNSDSETQGVRRSSGYAKSCKELALCCQSCKALAQPGNQKRNHHREILLIGKQFTKSQRQMASRSKASTRMLQA